ncbi:hypothetical protein [Cellulosimicrobium sp. TH-20]|uniref:hypothetical protein n=1 Tax=Cellulosimicrobium sp. TH-20 TaxID=1980001 RepID=UPI0011A51CB6|nr:hypothetical protein [Cellulosimicrobium sp. TH-20]
MADGTGPIIGRIAIKVLPETKDFRRDLKKQLDRIEDQVKVQVSAELRKNTLDVSTRQAVSDVNRKSYAKRDGYAIKLRAFIDDDELNDELQRIVKKIHALGDIDLSDARAEIESVADSMEQVSDAVEKHLGEAERELDAVAERMHRKFDEMGERVDIQLKATADTHMAESDLKDLWDEWDGKEINLEPDVSEVSKRTVQAGLAWLTRLRTVTIAPVLDSKAVAKVETMLAALSGWRMLDATANNLKKMFENIDKNLPLVGSLAMAIAGLSAWLLAAASNTFALAQSLAQIASVALILPGILGGFAFGIGATIAVLKDFDNVLPSIGARLSQIQDLMSADFWGIAKGPISELADELLPSLEAGLRGTAASLGVYFAALSSNLKSALGPSLTGMFANLNDSILIASAGTGDMARALEILGRRGSEYLPRFATWFNDAAEGFANWLDEADKSGQLTEWIEHGIFELQELGRALSSAGSILASFARAAEKAGGSTLTMFADTLERVAEIAKGPVFQGNLVNVLQAAHEVMATIGRDSGPALTSMFESMSRTFAAGLRAIDEGLAGMLEGIAVALDNPAFQSGFVRFLDGISTAVHGLLPAFEPLGAAIGSLGTLLGVMAAQFGPLLASLLTQLSQLVVAVVPQIIPVVENLTSLLGTLLDTAGPALTTIVEFFVRMVAPVLESEAAVALLVGAFLGFKLVSAWTSAVDMLRGMREWASASLTHLGQLPGKLDKVAKAAGAAVAVLTVLAGIGEAVGMATGEAVPSVDKFALALEQTVDPVGEVGDAITQCVDPVRQLNDAFTFDIGNGWLGSIGGYYSDFNGLADAIFWAGERADGFTNSMVWLGDKLGMIQDPISAGEEAISNYDDALAQMVQSGNVEGAAEGAALFAQEAELAGKSSEWVAQQLDGYNLALEEYEYAQQKAAEAQQRAADAMASYESAMSAAGTTTYAALASINEASKGFVNFAEGADDAELSLDDWISKLEEQVAAQAAWADNMAILTERGVSQGVLDQLARLGPEGALRVQQLVDDTTGQWERLEPIATAATEGAVAGSVGKFAELSGRAVAALNTLPDDVKAELEKAGVVAYDAGGNVVDGFTDGIGDKIPDVERSAEDIATTMSISTANALEIRSPSRLFQRYGQFVVQGFTNGIQSLIGTVTTAVGWISSRVKIPNAITLLLGAGRSVVSGFTQGVSNVLGRVTDSMSDLASKVRVPNPVSILKAAGREVISGFIEGIQSGFSRVRTKLQELTNMLPDWKGPAKTDRVILRDAGHLVIDGFIEGLEDRFKDVRSTLGDLTDMVEGTEIGAPDVDAGDIAGMSARQAARFAASSAGDGGPQKTFNYYAAPGSSLGSEEDLFAAIGRGRAVGF